MGDLAIMGWLVALVFGVIFWKHPFMLRFLAARMWARAHAIEAARSTYSKLVAEIEGAPSGEVKAED